jgi:hypothetical protein
MTTAGRCTQRPYEKHASILIEIAGTSSGEGRSPIEGEKHASILIEIAGIRHTRSRRNFH